ncbi:acyl-protein thioesterase [Colletotrichum cuscutae]|uniref:Acyl-protein thioesterase n=1 Tax=Colletotrichum cuscutae TaxID=1209917 RepID=A0AAJ0DNH0_9PEZI|nr:acyl-protein thioesterase [Colletotrichum cuscutae]
MMLPLWVTPARSPLGPNPCPTFGQVYRSHQRSCPCKTLPRLLRPAELSVKVPRRMISNPIKEKLTKVPHDKLQQRSGSIEIAFLWDTVSRPRYVPVCLAFDRKPYSCQAYLHALVVVLLDTFKRPISIRDTIETGICLKSLHQAMVYLSLCPDLKIDFCKRWRCIWNQCPGVTFTSASSRMKVCLRQMKGQNNICNDNARLLYHRIQSLGRFRRLKAAPVGRPREALRPWWIPSGPIAERHLNPPVLPPSLTSQPRDNLTYSEKTLGIRSEPRLPLHTFPPPMIIPPLKQPHQQTIILLHGRGSSAKIFAPELLSVPLDNSTTSPGLNTCTFRDLLPHTRFVFPTAPRSRATIYRRAIINQWYDGSGDWEDTLLGHAKETVLFYILYWKMKPFGWAGRAVLRRLFACCCGGGRHSAVYWVCLGCHGGRKLSTGTLMAIRLRAGGGGAMRILGNEVGITVAELTPYATVDFKTYDGLDHCYSKDMLKDMIGFLGDIAPDYEASFGVNPIISFNLHENMAASNLHMASRERIFHHWSDFRIDNKACWKPAILVASR